LSDPKYAGTPFEPVREGIAQAMQADLTGQVQAFSTQEVGTAGEIASSHAALARGVDDIEPHHTIHATPYPGDLMSRYREEPLPQPPGDAGPGRAWHTHRTPYGDQFEPQRALEQCDTSREAEDVTKATLGIAGIATGNPVLGTLGATLGVEGSLKDLFKCEPPGGVH
jgi:hypothetical protein